MAAEVNGVSVLICRVKGEYYAVANRCSHASQPLASGKLDGYELVCPLHGARFDVRTGQQTAPPATRPIKTFPLRMEGSTVHLEVSAQDRPPRPKFGPLY
jgi:3-phenylpropionate/trans-cinnamate dioxygenase ferredoxin subunit